MGIICLYVLIQKSGQKTAKSHLCAMWTPRKKSGFEEYEIFLGFETDPDFSNQKSRCILKGQL